MRPPAWSPCRSHWGEGRPAREKPRGPAVPHWPSRVFLRLQQKVDAAIEPSQLFARFELPRRDACRNARVPQSGADPLRCRLGLREPPDDHDGKFGATDSR
jgi:hypothetical protein